MEQVRRLFLGSILKKAGVLMNAVDFEFLKNTPYFNDCDHEQLNNFTDHFEKCEYEADTFLFYEGSIAHGWYFLLKGEVAIVRNGKNGPPHVLAELSPGEAFGEMSLLEQRPRMGSAVTLTPVTVLRLSKPQFEQLLDKCNPIAVGMLRAMATAQCRRLRELTDTMQDMTSASQLSDQKIQENPLDLNTLIRSGMLLMS